MSDDGPDSMGRRAFLTAAAGTAATAAATSTATAQEDVVEVELGDYYYEPGTEEPLHIEPGTTVRFVWITDNHDITIDAQPDASDWEGVSPTRDTGFEHEWTFDVEGTYEFHCTPHVGLGMEGTIIVTEDIPEEREVAPAVPESAMTLGIATAFALVATLGFAYVFLKYGGESTESP